MSHAQKTCKCGQIAKENDLCSHGVADGVCCPCQECRSQCQGAESEWYCDIHEDILLLHDGDGGFYCDECDEECGFTG